MLDLHVISFPATMELFFFFLIFWSCSLACRILVPQPGIKPVPPAVEVQCINHWTTREVPMQAKSLQSCLTLCNPMDCCLPGSSVHGTPQAQIQYWSRLPCSSPDLPNPEIEPASSHSAGSFFTASATWEAPFYFLNFHSNPKERQCQRMFKLPHNYAHLTL